MSFALRLKPAIGAAFKHLLASVLVALAVAALVFGIWYPQPYGELAGGQDLFRLLVAVDVVCGPLLTLVVYSPRKPRTELIRDIGLVVLIQLAALGYGLHSMMQARPVWLAFEGDRFRVVSVPDLLPGSLQNAPLTLRSLSLTGPLPLGVRLVAGTDANFQDSVRQALEGHHPAFRPERWVDYAQQSDRVRQVAKPLSGLQARYPQHIGLFVEVSRRTGLAPAEMGYLPLMAEQRSDWVVLVNRKSGEPVDYLPLDGWED